LPTKVRFLVRDGWMWVELACGPDAGTRLIKLACEELYGRPEAITRLKREWIDFSAPDEDRYAGRCQICGREVAEQADLSRHLRETTRLTSAS
jgi:hypothetical protein